MKSSLMLVLLFAVSMNGQIPYIFQAGSVAKASEVNADFLYLSSKIDSLNKRLVTLEQTKFTIGRLSLQWSR
jgi:hypothetical protein